MNGAAVDGEAGTRSWSQYDVRVLYHTYDVAAALRGGAESGGAHYNRGGAAFDPSRSVYGYRGGFSHDECIRWGS